MKNNFCHLHLHSEHSLLDGFGSAKQYISKAKDLGMQYLAITDHGGVDGCLEWQRECDKQNMGCVLGCEAYIVPDANIKKGSPKSGHITILCKNLKGWQELCRMLTKANLDGFYKKPRLDFPTLLAADLSGLIILTGCTASFLKFPGSKKVLEKLKAKMPGRLYLEIMPHDFPMQHEHHKLILKLHEAYSLPLVCSNDAHYIEEDDWETQEVLLAIQTKAKWDDKKRWKFDIKGLHLRTEREMLFAFRKHAFSKKQIEGAMANTVKIAKECCDFRIPKQEISLPSPYKNADNNQWTRELCWEKINKDKLNEKYQDRFKQEFKLIKKKKFARYFLIVYDVIQWCRQEGIAYGPGRGSVGGSLIAYLLGITKVDPIKFHLSFARFISEDRNDLPDIDIDFEKRYREKVREYLINKYGKNSACGISTDMKMQSRSAIQSVARVFDIDSKDVNKFTNAIWKGDHENGIQSAIDKTKDGEKFAKKYPRIIHFAKKMEGQIRGAGQHASAVIISNGDLRTGKKCVLVRRKERIVCNWGMEDSEYVGLMKLDILGLSTLSVLAESERLINDETFPGKPFYLDNIPHNNIEVFAMITEGRTAGMFQISAKPTTDLCKEMGIDNFEDIVTALGLVRPGPADSGMADEYIKRKHSREWEPLHPIYEEITKDTFGIIVFQEQIMRVISKVAGLSESTADKIRKVIGKKRDPKEFEPYRKQFLKGCQTQKTLSKKEAKEFWAGLLKHASYSFNRSHSVSYAIIAYQTAWLKVNYPAEFICACLSFAEFDDKSSDPPKQKQPLLDEIAESGITVMPPKAGLSDATRWIIKDGKLYVPFIEIPGIDKQAHKYAKGKKAGSTRLQGFFGKELTAPVNKSRIDEILEELKVHNLEAIPDPEIIVKYLPFDIGKAKSESTLCKILGFPVNPIWKTLNVSESEAPKDMIKMRRFQNVDLLGCRKCNLIDECDRPVLPSVGMFNVIICGEAPGKLEDEYGRGFYEEAPAGELLWKELDLYKLTRRMFHVTNVCKCWPSKAKTPKVEHIDACMPWLKEEIKRLRPQLILALGNTCVKAFTDKDGGIKALSGTTEWIEEYGAWICWGMHPAAVKRNNGNREYFENGVRNFAAKFELLKPMGRRRDIDQGDIPF